MSCTDKSLTYLAGLGYNVIRHPDSTFAPLRLLGQQRGEFLILGTLNQLVASSSSGMPVIMADQAAADVNGQTSSSLKLGIGLNVLGNLVGALGGNLTPSLNYTNATQVEFQYADVLTDSVLPLDTGNYLKGAHVDSDNLVLKQYVLGNGSLYLITKIVKSNKFNVKFTKGGGTAASVEIPVIQQAVGGSISVTADGASGSTLTFEGKIPIPFGFQCFHVGVEDGVLSLVNQKAGTVFGLSDQELTPSSEEPKPIVFHGLFSLVRH